jgi:hypothetical protein
MVVIDEAIEVSALLQQLVVKFNESDKDSAEFKLQYTDTEGDVIDLEDAEDLKLFLASTSQKLLNLTGR